MKRVIAVIAVGLSVLGGVSMASRESSDSHAAIDETAVHAMVDARLHQVLTGVMARRAAD